MAAALFQSSVLRTPPLVQRLAPRPAPTLFAMPGLAARPLHEPDEEAFPVLRRLRGCHSQIVAEWKALSVAETPSDYHLGKDEHQLHDGGRWDWHRYACCPAPRRPALSADTLGGQLDTEGRCADIVRIALPCHGRGVAELRPADEGCAAAVASCRFLADVPYTGRATDVPFAFAFFSTLHPGGSIKPHCAPCNLRLRVHWPLVVPAGDVAGLRVANESRVWKEGEAIVFDDSFEHEAWHKGGMVRAHCHAVRCCG